ncbi:hypothetical protein DMH04_19570 [Kibdelosporangium aridum]|uniref:Uncharacterized protein n=1 Tax=Kibdelosporangium aridum TaxID=2030 RepID=A0A428Z9K8_KIBAR|nr:hypothetical protein DMH04_19570 [Kibdelosporangium aridum]
MTVGMDAVEVRPGGTVVGAALGMQSGGGGNTQLADTCEPANKSCGTNPEVVWVRNCQKK